ncbi:hypothetical protein JKG47_01680 [Acidithiobacillus sp. MC6.1]|nr:hypothetical protein [Acidithiobacillus sp. MC6.1]
MFAFSAVAFVVLFCFFYITGMVIMRFFNNFLNILISSFSRNETTDADIRQWAQDAKIYFIDVYGAKSSNKISRLGFAVCAAGALAGSASLVIESILYFVGFEFQSKIVNDIIFVDLSFSVLIWFAVYFRATSKARTTGATLADRQQKGLENIFQTREQAGLFLSNLNARCPVDTEKANYLWIPGVKPVANLLWIFLLGSASLSLASLLATHHIDLTKLVLWVLRASFFVSSVTLFGAFLMLFFWMLYPAIAGWKGTALNYEYYPLLVLRRDLEKIGIHGIH